MTSIEWVKNIDGSDGKSWNPIRARRLVDDGKGGKKALSGWHCEHVHEGCKLCYAEGQNEAGFRGGTKLPYKPGHRKDVDIFLDEKVLLAPLHWRKPSKVFPCSMTDLYGDWVTDEMLDKVHAVMALQSQHTWIVLTKRPARRLAYLNDPGTQSRIEAQMDALAPAHWCSRKLDDVGGLPLKNVWQLVSCSEQKDVDQFIPMLLETPATVRGVSLEPLLGPVDLKRWMPSGRWGSFEGKPVYHQTYFMTKCEHCGWFGSSELAHVASYGDDADVVCPQCNQIFICDEFGDGRGLHWVIAGGESGASGRWMHPDWERWVRQQCERANVPYFRKQWGAWAWAPEHLNFTDALSWGRKQFGLRVAYTHHSSGHTSFRVGKKKSGNLREGVAHMAWPEVRA